MDELNSSGTPSSKTTSTITLKKGTNPFIFKIANEGYGGYFYARFVNASGNSLTNVDYQYSNLPLVVLPTSASNYTAGNQLSVSWMIDTSVIHGAVSVNLSVDGGRTWNDLSGAITRSTSSAYIAPNLGTFAWTVVDSFMGDGNAMVRTASSKCLLRVYAAYDGSGYSSSSKMFTIGNPVATVRAAGLSDTYLSDNIRISGKQLLVSIYQSSPWQVKIFDAFGRGVWSAQGSQATQLNVPRSSLSSSINFVSLKMDGKTMVKKVIVY